MSWQFSLFSVSVLYLSRFFWLIFPHRIREKFLSNPPNCNHSLRPPRFFPDSDQNAYPVAHRFGTLSHEPDHPIEWKKTLNREHKDRRQQNYFDWQSLLCFCNYHEPNSLFG